MALWGNSSNNGNALTPPGVGNGISQEQMSLFASAAQSSGLQDLAMQKMDSMTGGLKNEDQVQLLYHLMAVQPNEVSLFFLEYPQFITEFAALIGLIVRRELFNWFNSGAIPATINAEKAASAGYSTITDENITAQIAKVIPAQEMQMKIHQADTQAMQMMGAHHQQMMMGNMQQQQVMQQQMMQQQMMGGQQMPQRQGIGGALGNFGSSLIRGSLGLPPAPQTPMQAQAPMYNGYPQ
jgi:hypothetical protein